MSYRKSNQKATAILLLSTLTLLTPTLAPFSAQAAPSGGHPDRSASSAAERASASGDYDSRTNNPNDRYYKDRAHKFYDGQTRDRTSAAAKKIVNEQKQRAYIEKAYAPTQAAPPRAENASAASSVTEATAPTTQPAAPGTNWGAMPSEQLLHEYLTQTQHLNAVQKQDFTAKLPPNVQTELRNQDAYHRRLGDALDTQQQQTGLQRQNAIRDRGRGAQARAQAEQAKAAQDDATSESRFSTTNDTNPLLGSPTDNHSIIGGIVDRAINGVKDLLHIGPKDTASSGIQASTVPGVATNSQFRDKFADLFAKKQPKDRPEGGPAPSPSDLRKFFKDKDPGSVANTMEPGRGENISSPAPPPSRRNSTAGEVAPQDGRPPQQFPTTPDANFDPKQVMKDATMQKNLQDYGLDG